MADQGHGASPLDSKSDAHYTTQELLSVYATIAAQGNNPAEAYPAVAAHLVGCPACQADLDELLDLTNGLFSRRVPRVTSYPPLDLSFLPARSLAAPWQVDPIGRLVVTFSQALLDTLRPPLLAGGLRSSLLYRYVQEPGAVPGLNVRIEVFADDQQPEMGILRVQVELLSREPFAQGGSEIVLQANDGIWRDHTDDTGAATFTAIPLRALPHLRLEITPAPDSAP